jgi:hypothetical protein
MINYYILYSIKRKSKEREREKESIKQNKK